MFWDSEADEMNCYSWILRSPFSCLIYLITTYLLQITAATSRWAMFRTHIRNPRKIVHKQPDTSGSPHTAQPDLRRSTDRIIPGQS